MPGEKRRPPRDGDPYKSLRGIVTANPPRLTPRSRILLAFRTAGMLARNMMQAVGSIGGGWGCRQKRLDGKNPGGRQPNLSGENLAMQLLTYDGTQYGHNVF